MRRSFGDSPQKKNVVRRNGSTLRGKIQTHRKVQRSCGDAEDSAANCVEAAVLSGDSAVDT